MREVWEFCERWLGRAHLIYWLWRDGIISIVPAVMSAWWVHATGGTWIGIFFAGAGAFAIAFAVIAILIGLVRQLGPFEALNETAANLYGRTRGSEIAEFAEGSSSSPDEILDWYAYWMVQHGVRIYGKRPPSPMREEIPKDQIEGRLHFAGGATRLVEIDNSNPVFVDLCVRRADIRSQRDTLMRAR
jgi:hypothetical protein